MNNYLHFVITRNDTGAVYHQGDNKHGKKLPA